MKRKNLLLIILIFSFFIAFTAYSQEEEKEPGMFSSDNPYKTGIIFNVDDAFLDLESYRGGVGFKRYMGDKWALRALLDASASTNTNSWLITLGGAFEYHYITGRITPYVGGFLESGLIHVREDMLGDDFRTMNTVPIRFGPFLGIEVAPFNFLSFFVEYSLQFDVTTTTTKDTIGGVETKDTDTEFSVDTGIGNNSKIGIVFYINRMFTPKN